MPQCAYNSPIGPLTVFEHDGKIVSVDWGWPPESEESPLLLEAVAQLEAYFAGTLKRFDLPLDPPGTAFQRKVWRYLDTIGFGQVRTYGDIARELGSAPRAVGGACGRNPIPIIIPCHRVLAANGGLGGYSGMDGIETKQFLLQHEGIRQG